MFICKANRLLNLDGWCKPKTYNLKNKNRKYGKQKKLNVLTVITLVPFKYIKAINYLKNSIFWSLGIPKLANPTLGHWLLLWRVLTPDNLIFLMFRKKCTQWQIQRLFKNTILSRGFAGLSMNAWMNSMHAGDLLSALVFLGELYNFCSLVIIFSLT